MAAVHSRPRPGGHTVQPGQRRAYRLHREAIEGRAKPARPGVLWERGQRRPVVPVAETEVLEDELWPDPVPAPKRTGIKVGAMLLLAVIAWLIFSSVAGSGQRANPQPTQYVTQQQLASQQQCQQANQGAAFPVYC